MAFINGWWAKLGHKPRQVLMFVFWVVLIFGGCFGVNDLLFTSFQRYRVRDAQVRPLYAKLNMDVFNQIPAPDGVKEVYLEPNDSTVPSGPTHGSVLSASYLLENTTIEKITSHYENILITTGWQRLRSGLSFFTYSKGTGCFEFSFIPPATDYHINIQHEYFKQDFTPKMPPLWVIRLNESGETIFTGCAQYSNVK